MAAKQGDYDIPFDRDGNQLPYVDGWMISNKHVEMRPNEEFDDILKYKRYERGRSAVNFLFERKNGATVSVFLSDFDDMMPHILNGKIRGKFTFVKKGGNYGCKLVKTQ